jgi:hypothetical protein
MKDQLNEKDNTNLSDSGFSDEMPPIENESVTTFKKTESDNMIICGLYCQHTSSEVQRNIISSILKQLYRKLPFDYSAAISGKTGYTGTEKYIINAKWWRNW